MSVPLSKPSPLSRVTSLLAAKRGRDADRQVDEEDPVPVDGLGQHAARQQADRAAGRGDERVDAEGLRLLLRLLEHRHDHPQDHRRGEGTADALDEPRADQDLLALGEAAHERGGEEDRHPHHEDVLAPQEVTEPPGEKQKPAEGDQVAVDDPREAGLAEAEILLDRGQRDVHHRHVEHDHEEARAQDV